MATLLTHHMFSGFPARRSLLVKGKQTASFRLAGCGCGYFVIREGEKVRQLFLSNFIERCDEIAKFRVTKLAKTHFVNFIRCYSFFCLAKYSSYTFFFLSIPFIYLHELRQNATLISIQSSKGKFCARCHRI